MPPESGNAAFTVQLWSPVTYFASPTYSAATYDTPSRVIRTNRPSLNFVLRLSIAASLPRADQHRREHIRTGAVRLLAGRALRLLLVVDRTGQVAEDRAER